MAPHYFRRPKNRLQFGNSIWKLFGAPVPHSRRIMTARGVEGLAGETRASKPA